MSAIPDQEATVGQHLREAVLRTRLETILTNLEQVRLAKDFVAGRRSEISNLSELFRRREGIRGTLRHQLRLRLKHALDFARELDAAEDNPAPNLEMLRTNLNQAMDLVNWISEQAKSTERIALTMGTRWSAFAPDPFDEHVDASFKQEAVDLIKLINAIDYTDLAGAWETYRKRIRDPSDELFSEYVEFLGGLALRDTGLGGLIPSVLQPLEEGPDVADGNDSDDSVGATPGSDADEAEYNRDVYLMADELVRQIYYIGSNALWHSMAVPGRSTGAARSISRMIRLGFPDWTVWGVPLAAFQFGLVVVDENRLVAKYAELEAVSEGDLRIALADAFATFALGPAYALASILIKLEPTGPLLPGKPEPEPEPLSDTERVLTILTMLRLMDEGSKFESLVQDLDASWKETLRLNGVSTDLPEASVARVSAWCESMYQFLDENGKRVCFKAERWEAATRWPDLTKLEESGFVLPGVRPELQSVRDLLSAVWYQRLESPDKSRELAVAALGFWRPKPGPSKGGSPTDRTV